MTPGAVPLRLPCESTYGLPHPESGEHGAAAAEAASEAVSATTAALLFAHELAAALGEQEHQLACRAERVRDGVEVGQGKGGPHTSADLGDEDVAGGHASGVELGEPLDRGLVVGAGEPDDEFRSGHVSHDRAETAGSHRADGAHPGRLGLSP